MTAYPETCLIDHEDGIRTTLTLESPSDADTERGAIARLCLTIEDGSPITIGLSPAAVDALIARLRELRPLGLKREEKSQ